MASKQQRNGNERRSVSDLLKEQVQVLNEEISSVEEELQPLRDKLDSLHKEQFELRAQEDELVQQIRRIEQDQLISLRQDLSRAARASGGRALSDNPSA